MEDFFIRDRYLTALGAKEFGLVDEIPGGGSDVVRLDSPELHVAFAKDLLS